MKICFVSTEILGAHKNGGIGTATSNLAILFASNGHSVTLLYAGEGPPDPGDPWISYYSFFDVQVRQILSSHLHLDPPWLRNPTALYDELKGCDFDLIIFQDWLGLAWSCVTSKHCGLDFPDTKIAVIAHSNTEWLLEANRAFPAQREHLALSHIERTAIQFADSLVSPSSYLLQWMKDNSWVLPAESTVIPLFLDGEKILKLPKSTRTKASKSDTHFVFFGRLEERKGINLFLKAITSSRLAQSNFRISFLGKPASISPAEIRDILSDYRPDLLGDDQFYTDFSSDAAQDYLVQENCICVIPSLTDNSPCVIYECLRRKIPFIASNTGGIAELVSDADRGRCLFEPNAEDLACLMAKVVESDEWLPATPSINQENVANLWLRWVEQLCSQHSRRDVIGPRLKSESDTTVVVTHYQRPKLLRQCLLGLSAQDDPNFEVLVVDDGSEDEASLSFLQELTRGFHDLKLQVVRQQNRYLGAARNTGLSRVNSPRVIFLDDDNIPCPNLVSVFKTAAFNSDADIVSCQMALLRDLDERFNPECKAHIWGFSAGPPSLGIIMNCFGDATSIYKTEVVREVGGFHEIHGVTHEDWQLHLKAALRSKKVLSLSLPLFWYRVAETSMIRTTSLYRNMLPIIEAASSELPKALRPLLNLAVGARI